MLKFFSIQTDLVLVELQLIQALLSVADGHHEVHNGGELVEEQVKSVGERRHVPVEVGRDGPVEGLDRINLDSSLLQRGALLPPVQVSSIQRVAGLKGDEWRGPPSIAGGLNRLTILLKSHNFGTHAVVLHASTSI